VNTSTGQIAERIDYDEFGNVITDANPGFQPFVFTGELYDQDTKLLRFGARDYDPSTGRWTAKDPILYAGNDTNLFGYALDDPVNLTDSPGLDVESWIKSLFCGKKCKSSVKAEPKPEPKPEPSEANGTTARKLRVDILRHIGVDVAAEAASHAVETPVL
jgi:RHS repeat-associated protein